MGELKENVQKVLMYKEDSMVHLSPSPESLELHVVEKGRSPGLLFCRLPIPKKSGTVA